VRTGAEFRIVTAELHIEDERHAWETRKISTFGRDLVDLSLVRISDHKAIDWYLVFVLCCALLC
jgi:hypothetical protein